MLEAVQRRRCGKTGNPLRFEIQKLLHPLGEAYKTNKFLINNHLTQFLNFKCLK
jgi:hypothetical protein